MLSDVRNYYGFAKDFGQAGYFETEHSEQIVRELKLEIKVGKLVALSGIIGSGKSTMLRRIQEALAQDKEILVSKSLSLEKGQISLATLIMALFYDLAIEKEFKIPTQPERRERALRDLIRKRQRPIALFIDDAHDLHSKTLTGLKRLIEVVRDSGGTLSVVLAGHPKLKNDLRRPSMEETGSRATIFELEGLGSEKPAFTHSSTLSSSFHGSHFCPGFGVEPSSCQHSVTCRACRSNPNLITSGLAFASPSLA